MGAKSGHRVAERRSRIAAWQPAPARPRVVAMVLGCFVVVFTLLELASLTSRSATWDEPIHLTAGYVALAHADHRVDPTHPPFLRMWGALPLLPMNPTSIDVAAVDQAPRGRLFSEGYDLAHRFLYRLNDADRLLLASRSMIVLLGVTLGLLLYWWTSEWLGWLPAVVGLAFYTMEPNLFAHASLVTTDLGIACFTFGAVFFLWRTCREFSVPNLAGLVTFVALAFVSKFSAILLAPIVALLLGTAVLGGRISVRRAVIVAALLALTTYVAIWAAYGFRYAPSASETWLVKVQDDAITNPVTALLSWIDSYRLLPNAYTQGFLLSQSSLTGWPAFLSGQVSTDGWWYYFPVAFLLKTPVAVIALFVAGLVLCVRRRRDLDTITLVFLLVPVAMYLAFAIASGINMGVRHILPVYPFVLILGAVAVRALLAAPAKVARPLLAGLLIMTAVEVARAYPRPLTFFNAFAGGPTNGFRYLADSNLAWGGNLKALKNWMDENDVAHVNLAYFGTADPSYYGIDCTFLPGSPSFAIDLISKPRLPGYVAISGTILSGPYLDPRWRLFYRSFWTREPAAIVGNTMRVYWVDSWPEDHATTTADAHVHRSLADALLLGMGWAEHSAVHYKAYLAQFPGDATALMRLGVSLAESGRVQDSIDVFTRVTELVPGDASAHRNLEEARRRAGLASIRSP